MNFPKMQVKKHTLLLIAGCVWMIAGFNVGRLGVLAYQKITEIPFWYLLLSLLVFIAFGAMFCKMSLKHAARIHSYDTPTRAFWHFFDLKAYLIMIFMMSGGIWLRSSGLAPNDFIAVFYTGLGFALASAGVSFLYISKNCEKRG